MRPSHARPALAFLLSCTFVFGCSLLKKKSGVDAGDPTTDNAPTVTVTGTGAKNEKDVLRYASETKVANEPATIGKDTKAKTFPASGADVASLSKGTAVVKIATFFSTGVLVVFDDPAGDGTKLMGWISPESLAVAPVATNTAPVFTATTPKLVVVDAGAKDAGGVADAGAAADAGKAADAGAVAVAGSLIAVPVGSKCPTGFVLVGSFCRRPCVADGDCPKGAFCTAASGRKTCAATK